MVFGVLFLRLLLCQVLQNVAFISRDILGARKRKQTDRQRKGDLHKSSKRTRVIWQTRLLATRPRGLTAKENDVFEVTLASPATTRVSSPPPPPFFLFPFLRRCQHCCRCCKFSFSFQLFVGGKRAIHVPFLDWLPTC